MHTIAPATVQSHSHAHTGASSPLSPDHERVSASERTSGEGELRTQPSDHARPSTGLVTCAKKEFLSIPAGQTPRFAFPTAEECATGAAAVGGWGWDGREGPVPQLEVAPGLVRLTAPDLNRREKTVNRMADAPPIVSLVDGAGEETAERMITGWSRRSRARMVATMAELDLAPLLMQEGAPAMVTLTYPADWEAVAPDGPTSKAHLKEFFARYARAWGHDWMGIWKLEFQQRGAPHFHLLMVPPSELASKQRRAEFEQRRRDWERGLIARKPRWKAMPGDGENFRRWLSLTWADIVAHPDPVERMKHERAGTGVDYSEGQRARDPKRAAIYFGKHGSFAAKNYQHDVPELWKKSGKTVGRFWGYRGLTKIKGAATINFDQMLLLGRTLRRYGTRTRVWDVETGTHHVRPVLRTVYRDRAATPWVTPAGVVILRWKKRRQTVRARRMTGPMSAGFLLVNDGPAMARDLARVLATCGNKKAPAPPVGLRGSISQRAS